VRWLRTQQYAGDVVARMAVSEQSNIFDEVTHLLELEDPSFDHVHWQLNAIWDAPGNWNDFPGWVRDSYNPGITRLMQYWVEGLQQGKIRGIVPFLPLMNTMLKGEPTQLWCGAGIDFFAIHVNGDIGVCPIEPDWEFAIVGDIYRTNPKDLHNIMPVGDPCPTCPEYEICGGRCLFTNKERLWGEEGYKQVCGTVEHLITELKKAQPEIEGLISSGKIDPAIFEYPEYNNGCEIIP
ncbi:MAG: TIGR04084 family radical SAM/SPASM domain-containing protein, partial [Candidatus Ranarchaeia archaeon]